MKGHCLCGAITFETSAMPQGVSMCHCSQCRRQSGGIWSSAFVAQDIVKMMVKRKLRVDDARILVMGFTFKENCPDVRNTKIADLVRELDDYAAEIVLYDPQVNPDEVKQTYNLVITNDLPEGPFDAVVLAVAHSEIVALGPEVLNALLSEGGLIYDIKGIVPPESRGGGI